MRIIAIAAIGNNREIGKDNDLLWKLADDMKFFKETTKGYCVITGRKNYESIPERFRPLPNRLNIILTRHKIKYPGAKVASSLRNAVAIAHENKQHTVFIIGGGEIYKLFLEADLIDEMYITHVKADYPDAQVFFPEFNPGDWKAEGVASFKKDHRNQHDFKIIHYTK